MVVVREPFGGGSGGSRRLPSSTRGDFDAIFFVDIPYSPRSYSYRETPIANGAVCATSIRTGGGAGQDDAPRAATCIQQRIHPLSPRADIHHPSGRIRISSGERHLSAITKEMLCAHARAERERRSNIITRIDAHFLGTIKWRVYESEVPSTADDGRAHDQPSLTSVPVTVNFFMLHASPVQSTSLS